MKISVDLDGILSSFNGAVVGLCQKALPGKVPLDYKPSDWDWTDVLTKKDWDIIWREIDQTEDFWAKLESYPDNIIALRNFLATHSGQEVYFVTSRRTGKGRPVAIQTDEWLVYHNIYPHGNYTAVIPVANSNNKALVMEALEIDYSIDDYGRTIEQCNRITSKHKAFLLDRSWNRDKEYGPRVNSLSEFFESVIPWIN